MSLPVECADLVGLFWSIAGEPPTIPRDLAGSVVWFPFTVVTIPGLRLSSVCDWLAERGSCMSNSEADRSLRGCLFASMGRAYAFLDANDPPAEQRFSLAHEIGHYLRDYWHPREIVKSRIGRGGLDVLDGLRPPSQEERLHALLRNAAVGPFAHLLRRDSTGRPLTSVERDAEAAADRLAFELLAPECLLHGYHRRENLRYSLIETYGLPPEPASRYAALLLPESPAPGSIVARLGAP